MLNLCICLMIFTSFIFANKDFVDHGKKSTNPYSIQIISNDHISCTSTMVAYNKLLTAAHCVLDVSKSSHKLKYLPGDKLSTNYKFKVTAVDFNKDYLLYLQKFKNMKVTDKDYDHTIRMYTINDIAIISTDAQKKDTNYPKIVTNETKFKDRKRVKFNGYGATTAEYRKETGVYEFEDLSVNAVAIEGENDWSSCPMNYDKRTTPEIEKLIKEAQSILSFKSKTVHNITDTEEIQEHDSSMVLPGDSGSAGFEKDSNDKSIITSVASNINIYVEGSGHPFLLIKIKNKNTIKLSPPEFIEGWGDKTIDNLKFEYIFNELMSRNLIVGGLIREDVTITRQYTRVAKANFADLLYPKNQIFIKTIMGEKK